MEKQDKADNKKRSIPKQPQVTDLNDLLPDLPDASEEKKVIIIQASEVYSGSIPHPKIIAGYESIKEGFGDRILALIEKQSEHRQFMEKESLQMQHNEIKRGQNYAFLIGSIAIISGCVTAIMGAVVPGALIGTGGVVGLVSAFIYGAKKRTK